MSERWKEKSETTSITNTQKTRQEYIDRCKRRQATDRHRESDREIASEKNKKRKCAKSHRLGVTPWDLVCV